MNRLSTIIDGISERIGHTVSWLALVMVLIGSWNAVTRYTDKEVGTALSSNTWLEAGWYLFSILFLLGAAWTLKNDAHVRVDVLYSRLSDRGKAWVDLLGSLLLLIPFTIFILLVVWPTVVVSWEIKESSPDPGGLPRWPIRAVVPIAIFLLMLQGISMAIKAGGKILEKKENDQRPIDQGEEGV